MLLIARVVSGLVFLAGIWWVIKDPKIESYLAAGAALVAFIAFFVVPKLTAGQVQKVSGGSKGTQAGGNIHIGRDNK